MIPIFILQTWLLGLVSLGFVGGAVYLMHRWQQNSWQWNESLGKSVFSPDLGANEDTLFLGLAVLLFFVILMGQSLVKALALMFTTKKSENPPLGDSPQPIERQQIRKSDGSELRIECYGRADGIPILCSHGWGMNSSVWDYLKRDLENDFRIIVWDEPGLGKSSPPLDADYSLEKLAGDLKAVMEATVTQPVILVGHSIGGMIILTLCHLFPKDLRTHVAGIVLTHTTPTDPVHTTSGAAFYKAIENPVLKPLMYLTLALSPLVRVINWFSYRNGTAHLMTKIGSFAGAESWDQIEHITRLQTEASPAVLARGMLGMMRYDASHELVKVLVPTLVVAGNRDTTTQPEASEWIYAEIPNAELIELAPAKHYGYLEHRTKYAAAVKKFAHKAVSKMEVELIS